MAPRSTRECIARGRLWGSGSMLIWLRALFHCQSLFSLLKPKDAGREEDILRHVHLINALMHQ